VTGPRRPHEPAELRLTLSRGPDGGLVIRTPMTPGWAFCAMTPAQLAHGIEQAFAECAIAAYARFRGVLYDLAETEEEVPAAALSAGSRHPAEPTLDEVERRRRRNHPGTHPPEAWVELEDGAMLSPRGKRYRPDSLTASRVRARRAGLR
jgi:hypothetical protein